MQHLSRWKADLALIMVSLVWGLSFIAIKYALQYFDPLWLLFFRNLSALLFLLAIGGKKLLFPNRKCFVSGTMLGLMLFLGYLTQTVGLQYTTASKAGFITGLSVVIVPILSAIFLKKNPHPITWGGVLLATIGLGLISVDFSQAFFLTYGDFLVLICAFAFAGHLVLVAHFAPKMGTMILTIYQIIAITVACGLAGLMTSPLPENVSLMAILAMIFLGVAATAGAFLIQVWAQKFTSPTKTVLIFSLEPVFCAIFAYFFLQEYLTIKGAIGCTLIFLATILASLKE